jgi:glycosyltransferase involved in cell wall biosynthesis
VKILFISQFFWPEVANTSVLVTDFARFLEGEGHKVTVICGAKGYAGEDASARPNVKVVNVPTIKFGHHRAVRMLSYASFLVFAFAAALRRNSLPDVVITMTTPPLISLIGAFLKKVSGVKHYVWEMDMYPDVAVDLGVVAAHSVFTRAIGYLADLGRSHSDRIIALGECMKDRLLARGVPLEKIRIAGNWADGDPYKGLNKQPDRDQLIIVYTGNLGMGHDVETVSRAMLGLRSDPRLRFVFLGGGERMKELQSFCGKNRLENVEFLSYVARERFNDIMKTADIGLVTQNPDCVGSIVPSKFYSIAAAGLPILYIGAAHATPARLIDQFQCGWFVPAGQPHALESLLGRLANDRAQVLRLGAAALAAFRELWDRPVALQHLAEMLDLAARSVGSPGARGRLPGEITPQATTSRTG